MPDSNSEIESCWQNDIDDLGRAKSVALLVSDALRFTEEITDERKAVAIEALRLVAVGDVTTNEKEREIFKALLDTGWTLTAAFDPEFARKLMEGA